MKQLLVVVGEHNDSMTTSGLQGWMLCSLSVARLALGLGKYFSDQRCDQENTTTGTSGMHTPSLHFWKQDKRAIPRHPPGQEDVAIQYQDSPSEILLDKASLRRRRPHPGIKPHDRQFFHGRS